MHSCTFWSFKCAPLLVNVRTAGAILICNASSILRWSIYFFWLDFFCEYKGKPDHYTIKFDPIINFLTYYDITLKDGSCVILLCYFQSIVCVCYCPCYSTIMYIIMSISSTISQIPGFLVDGLSNILFFSVWFRLFFDSYWFWTWLWHEFKLIEISDSY